MDPFSPHPYPSLFSRPQHFAKLSKWRIIENMKVFFCFVFVLFSMCFLSCSCCIGVTSSLQHRHRVLESFNKNIEILHIFFVCVFVSCTLKAKTIFYSYSIFVHVGRGVSLYLTTSEWRRFKEITRSHLRRSYLGFLPG